MERGQSIILLHFLFLGPKMKKIKLSDITQPLILTQRFSYKCPYLASPTTNNSHNGFISCILHFQFLIKSCVLCPGRSPPPVESQNTSCASCRFGFCLFFFLFLYLFIYCFHYLFLLLLMYLFCNPVSRKYMRMSRI